MGLLLFELLEVIDCGDPIGEFDLGDEWADMVCWVVCCGYGCCMLTAATAAAADVAWRARREVENCSSAVERTQWLVYRFDNFAAAEVMD